MFLVALVCLFVSLSVDSIYNHDDQHSMTEWLEQEAVIDGQVVRAEDVTGALVRGGGISVT